MNTEATPERKHWRLSVRKEIVEELTTMARRKNLSRGLLVERILKVGLAMCEEQSGEQSQLERLEAAIATLKTDGVQWREHG